jgi:outer membrane protein assembly factor BamB
MTLRVGARIPLVVAVSAALTAFVTVSAHASSEWPQPGHDGGFSNYNTDEHVLTRHQIQNLVQLRSLNGWALGTSALIADGDLLTGQGANLTRRSVRGSMRWRSGVCSPSNLMIAGDTVVMNDDRQMGCAGGAFSWNTGDPTWEIGQLHLLTANDGLLIASDLQGDAENDVWDSLDLVAVDAVTGAERWRIERPGDAAWTNSARLQDGLLLVAFGNRQVESLDPETGAELWSWNVHDGRLIRLTALVGDTAFVVRSRYVGGDRVALLALDANDGSVRWRLPLGRDVVPSVAAGGGRVYVDIGTRLLALSVGSGERVWKTRLPERSSFGGSSLIGAAGVLYADLNSPGDIVVFAAADGERLGRLRHYGWPAVAAGRLVAIGTDHYGIGVFGLPR